MTSILVILNFGRSFRESLLFPLLLMEEEYEKEEGGRYLSCLPVWIDKVPPVLYMI